MQLLPLFAPAALIVQFGELHPVFVTSTDPSPLQLIVKQPWSTELPVQLPTGVHGVPLLSREQFPLNVTK
jgi:hypothetical protein